MEQTNDYGIVETAGKAVRREFFKLPKVAYFKIQSRGLVGAMKSRHERKTGAWAVLVALEGKTGLRLASDVAREYGMVFKCEFATKEDAIAGGKKFRDEWGKKGEKKTPAKKSAIEKTAEEFGMTVGELKAKLAK